MKFLLGLTLAAFFFLLVSCGKSAAPSGFLADDDARMRQNALLPFNRSYRAPNIDLTTYKEVVVAPMETERLQKLGRLDGLTEKNLGKQYKTDTDELATFATQAFEKAITENETLTLRAADSRGKSGNAVRLETNLVQAVPGRPSAQIANFFLPFVGLLNKPAIAIEGRLVDITSGETVFAFADRETAEISLYDARKFGYYTVQRREAERWADQLVKVMTSAASTKVSDPFFIQPIAW